jgi:hypothetical protein
MGTERIRGARRQIVAALTTTAQRNDTAGGYAKAALKSWQSRIGQFTEYGNGSGL